MKSYSRILSAALLIAAVTQLQLTALADEGDGQWYIAPMITLIDDDVDRGADDEFVGGQLVLGREISDAWNFEINLNGYNLHDTQTNALSQLRGVSLDMMHLVDSGGMFQPFLLGGFGYQSTHSNALGDSEDMTANAAFGLMTFLGDQKRAAIRAEARIRGVLGSPHYNDMLYSVGFQTKLGKPAPKAPVDSDGDGVPDDNDRCPGTPMGTAVDSNGCKLDGDSDRDGVKDSKDKCPNTARGAKVDSMGCKVKVMPPKDSDGDGVPDGKDACPNTVRGAKVDARGCEFDTDGDGVVDSQDRCANTASGVRVDVNGCEIRDNTINLPGVQFELNSAQLRPESTSVLDDAAATLNKYPEINVIVAGHTDSTGADTYNMTLSEKRAASVMAYLSSRGVDASRLQSRGYGETSPIADNSNKAGREANRRVELKIIN